MRRLFTIELISSLLILVFGYTAISKLLVYERFRDTLLRTPFVALGADVLALALPLAELGIVLLLLFPATRLKGLYVSLVALSFFTVYLVLMLLYAPHLPCSCGGVIGSLSWKGHVGLNLIFIGLTVIGIRRGLKGLMV